MFNKELFNDLIEKKNVTQLEVAAALGVSGPFVNYLRKGYKEPSFALAKRIADYFGVSMDDLVKDE